MASPTAPTPGDHTGGPAELTATERAVLTASTPAEALDFFSGYTRDRLGSPIARVRFRAGRIDAVWGVELDDRRAVVIKSHRLPSDLATITAARRAQRLLAAAGFPCPVPLSGPDQLDGHVLTIESLMSDGAPPDGRDPDHRRLLAAGLARHIAVLAGDPDLILAAGSGPSWCQYQAGPWPVPHDPIVDFRTTPAGYAWLDDFGRQAAQQILTHREADQVVVGHADWYAGNAAVAAGALAATFDWELVADTEAVIAGFTAACYAASSTSGGGLSTPEEAAAFLQDVEFARGVPFSDDERRAAAGAASWIVAFNARWQLGMDDDRHEDGTALELVRQRHQDYLALGW